MKRVLVSMFAVGVVVASSASAQEPGSSDIPLARPRWLQKPTGEQLANVYPVAAQRKRLGGRTTLSCAVKGDGRVADCSIVPGTETPEGYGFGEASLALAQFFRMAPDRSLAETRVAIPLTWAIAGEPNPPAPPAEEKRRLDLLRAALNPSAPDPLVEPVFAPTEGRFAALAPIGRWFPDLAQRAGVAGIAVLRCTVTEGQKLAVCQRLGDAPLDFGFEAAASAMAEAGYMRAPADQPVGAVVRVVVKFPKPGR